MATQPIELRGFEVKFALDAIQVLTPDGAPVPTVAAALGVADGPEEYDVAFFDTPHLDFHTERWNVRFRNKGGMREVSFKRRLPVYHGSVAGVLQTAMRQGFDAGEQEDGYEAEIEWGPERRTLSLIKEAKLGDGDVPTTATEAGVFVADKMPGKLRKWMRDGWTASVVTAGQVFGPVRARRWKWSAVPGKTAFEVWFVRSKDGLGVEPIVEVSFKSPDEAEAAASRVSLLAILEGHPGWLRAEDLLKTDMVLDRYR